MANFNNRVVEARDAVTARKLFQPRVAIVLGSGLAELADHLQHCTSISYDRIPHFPPTRADGHPGRMMLGFLGGMPVVVLQGRAHRYEGWSDEDVSFPVACCHSLGAETLILTNAAGGLNPRFRCGDLMVIDSHINLLWRRNYVCALDELPARQTRIRQFQTAYEPAMMHRALSVARRNDTVLHQGCYLATLGPTYETRSEYRMFRWMGADAVGMSTVPEVIAAHKHGMKVLAFSVITNVASPNVPQSTSHDEVIAAGQLAGIKLLQIILQLLDSMSGEPD